MKKNNWIALSIICSLVVMALSCQTAVEPDNIVPDGGFRAVVLVKDQGNNPVDGARVQWIIMQKGSTQQQIDAAFNNASGIQSAVTGSSGDAGLVNFQIPVPIAQAGVMVLFKTTPPATNQFLGNQKNGNFRVDTLTVCGTTFLEITLQRQESVQCNSGPTCQDLTLTIEPPVTSRDTVSQGDFTQTDGSVTIASVTGLPATFNGINIITSVFAGGTSSGIPSTVNQGVPYRIRFDVNAANSNAITDTSFIVTINAVRGALPCWSCTFRLRIIVKQQLNCECPRQGMHFTVGPDSVCVGQSKNDTLKNINLSNFNKDCGLLLRLNKGLLTEPISESFVTNMNATPGDEILLNSGQTLNMIGMTFQPQTARAYSQNFIFDMYRQTTNGLVKCDSQLTIRYVGIGGTPSFAVDTASSTLFVKKGTTFSPDTLKQCTIHPDPRTGRGTLCIRNTGTCDLDVDLSVINGSSVFSIDTNSLRVPPKKTVCVTVTFKPTNAEVYPNGRCNADVRDFTGAIRARSAFGSATIPLIGFANLDVMCAGKAVMISPQFGAKDVAGTTFNITLDILSDNTITNGEQANGVTDSVKIFVKQINTVGPPPNDANITGATLSTGQFQKVKYYWKANLKSLPSDICTLFNTFRCPDPTNALTDQPVVEGDVLLFEYKGSYGIMWIKKLAWSDHTNNALPQVEGLVCYPFN